ncbi:MAG: phage virion morphogenesis protein [Desulfofundulus sp.]
MVKVEIEIKGLEAAMTAISMLRERSIKTRPLMEEAGNILLQSVARNFEEEGRPTKWKPWSELTRKIYESRAVAKAQSTKTWQRAGKRRRESIEEQYKANYVAGSKILQSRNADLKKSVDKGRVTDTYVEIGSSLPYARIHQLGGVVRPKRGRFLLVPLGNGRFLRLREAHIPARPYLVVQDEDKRAIIKAVHRFIFEGELP